MPTISLFFNRSFSMWSLKFDLRILKSLLFFKFSPFSLHFLTFRFKKFKITARYCKPGWKLHNCVIQQRDIIDNNKYSKPISLSWLINTLLCMYCEGLKLMTLMNPPQLGPALDEWRTHQCYYFLNFGYGFFQQPIHNNIGIGRQHRHTMLNPTCFTFG